MLRTDLFQTMEDVQQMSSQNIYFIEDKSTCILNAHLIIEALLYKFMQSKIVDPSFFDEDNLTFCQIWSLAKALRQEKKGENWFWNVTEELDSIRDSLIHYIEMEDFPNRVKRLIALAGNHIDIHAPGADPKEREKNKLQIFLLILCAIAFRFIDDSFVV